MNNEPGFQFKLKRLDCSTLSQPVPHVYKYSTQFIVALIRPLRKLRKRCTRNKVSVLLGSPRRD